MRAEKNLIEVDAKILRIQNEIQKLENRLHAMMEERAGQLEEISRTASGRVGRSQS